jgi:hypothetical protein
MKAYSGGANTDHDKETQQSQDEFVDARNARLRGGNGKDKALEKIKGEVIIYPKNFNVGNYFCIGAFNVNEDIVEFWADRAGIEDPLIRVNGVVVCKSSRLGFTWNNPLQGDTNDSCVGGEVYVTDFVQAPYIFNVKDMVDSLVGNPTKYFAAFNPDLYKISLKTPLDMPVFDSLINVGGGGGLPYGSYAYSIRYVSEKGDSTNFSMETPPIDVPANYGTPSGQYDYVKTYGGGANPSFKSQYGIKIRFRITNIYNYSYIEVRRIAYNSGAGLSFVPSPEIIAKIPVSPGEIGIMDFIDPSDAFSTPLTLADSEDLQRFSSFSAAKSIRYYDKRIVLMNIKYPSMDVSNVQFLQENDGTSGFPIMWPLGKSGHSDPWNHTYRRNLMSAERYNYGAVILDGSGGTSHVKEMTATQMQDIQTVPNHRKALSARSLAYCVTSGQGAPLLKDTQNNINRVHEIWDLNDAVQKTNDSLVNICSESIPIISAAREYGILNPTSDGDGDVTEHDLKVNIQVKRSLGTWVNYNPQGFGPNWWSRGITIKGLNTASLPEWAKAFSIVRTKSAKRTVCQGIGIYSLSPAVKGIVPYTFSKGLTKETAKLWFHSPDIQMGFVDAAIIADMKANPLNYKVQLISPVGYFTEVYNNVKKIVPPAMDRSCDMITYARVQDEDGTINPTETPGQVEFGNYLNTIPNSLPVNTGPDFAETKFGLKSFNYVSEGRDGYYQIELDRPIYNKQSQGAAGLEGWDIDDGTTREFKEPFYIINIISDGAQPPKGNTTNYYPTGHYQKLTSIIGRSDGNPNRYDLIDERWEDCIPNKFDAGVANINTYLFIEDEFGVDHVWLNVTYKSATQLTTILNDIQINGFHYDGTHNIEGVYTSYDNSFRTFGVEFSIIDSLYSNDFYIPKTGSIIKVKYDNRFPIALFPGEHFVGENVFSPIDRYSPGNDNDPDENAQFLMCSGMPYHGHKFNSNYFVDLKSYGAGNNVQDTVFETLVDFVRQWVVMYPSESRAASHLFFGKTFPNVHYVVRPHRYKITSNMCTDNNKIYCQYFTDYPGEENEWGYGGFKFLPSSNADYSVSLNDRIYTSKPLVGFVEQNWYCSRVIWSIQRAVNAQDVPGLKTFPSLNVRDISDNQGCINYAYDANTGRGTNLYAICSRGICLLTTNKNTLSDANAGQIAYMQADNFISDEYWLSKDVGVPDEMWRTIAETSSATYGEARIDTLFLANKESAYALYNNNVKDIAKNEYAYHYRIFNDFSTRVRSGFSTHVTAGFDRKHEEYWLHIDGDPENGNIKRTFVFNQQEQTWSGYNDYRFDKFLANGSHMYGMRGLDTYKLNDGYVINGGNIVFEAVQAHAPEPAVDKEFIRVRINSSKKPTRVEFTDTLDGAIMCFLDPSQGTHYLKNYGGFEQYVPRLLSSVDSKEPRFQRRIIYYKIKHDLPEDFVLHDSGVQYKKIR